MKKFSVYPFLIVLVFATSSASSYSQDKHYPFKVDISGEGKQSIIFIPGFACSGEVWNETKSMYEKNYKCYALTMAGFAGVPPESKPTFQNWEKAIAQFILQNNIDQPALVGHSMGGGLAMALAADYPDLVSKIIVVDALPCLPALMNPSFKAKLNNDCSGIVSQIGSLSNDQFYRMQKQSAAQLVADTSKQELVAGWSISSDRGTFAEMYCDFSNTDLREKIATIACPALILLESYFSNFKPAITDQFKNLKNFDMRFATKGLHFVMYDDKEWYSQQLLSFMKQ